MSNLDVPDAYPCAFCEYLSGTRAYTILYREKHAAILVTRGQRGCSHMLVITTRHAPTILDINDAESQAVMRLARVAARAIDEVERRPGIAVWQNNGTAANQAIPHFHVHVAGTIPGGGTEWDEVEEVSLRETELIAGRLLPYVEKYSTDHKMTNVGFRFDAISP